jgi:hypothetical protein
VKHCLGAVTGGKLVSLLSRGSISGKELTAEERLRVWKELTAEERLRVWLT